MNYRLYRPGRPVENTTFVTLCEQCQRPEDLTLLELTARTQKPAMLALPDGIAIVKQAEDTDEGLTYEALVDIALNDGDLLGMKQRQSENPEPPLRVYECTLAFAPIQRPPLPARIVACSDGDLRRKVRQLLNEDEEFGDCLENYIIDWIRTKGVVVTVHEPHATVEAAEDAPEWSVDE